MHSQRQQAPHNCCITTRYRCLQVIVDNVLFQDRGATLLRTVQMLPVLTDLSIDFQGEVSKLRAPVSDSNGLSRCQELAQLRSRSLTDLKVWMLGGPPDGNTLRLSGLPALRSCILITEPTMRAHMRIDAKSFRGLSQLHCLCLHGDEGVQLQDANLKQLSGVTSLALRQCGLRSVPASIASLSMLCELDLGHNPRMPIDRAAVATIVQCSSLRAIGLSRPSIAKWEDSLGPAWQRVEQDMAREGITPAQFDESELTHLLHLPFAFRARHGWDLHVCLHSGGLCGNMSCHGCICAV